MNHVGGISERGILESDDEEIETIDDVRRKYEKYKLNEDSETWSDISESDDDQI